LSNKPSAMREARRIRASSGIGLVVVRRCS
jgi:hypothetical protein